MANLINQLYSRFDANTPLKVATLQAWYDFSNASSLFTDTARTTGVAADADVIKGVTDLSGVGNHLSEATNPPAYKVGILNGKSVSRFDGVNDLLSCVFGPTNITNATIFAACMFNAGGNKGVMGLAAGTVNTGYQIRRDAAPSVTVKTFDGAQRSSPTSLADATYGVISLVHDGSGGATITAYSNGAVGTPSAAGAMTTATSALKVGALENGSTFVFSGDLAELIIYSSALSATNHNKVGRYLATKYNFVWTTV